MLTSSRSTRPYGGTCQRRLLREWMNAAVPPASRSEGRPRRRTRRRASRAWRRSPSPGSALGQPRLARGAPRLRPEGPPPGHERCVVPFFQRSFGDRAPGQASGRTTSSPWRTSRSTRRTGPGGWPRRPTTSTRAAPSAGSSTAHRARVRARLPPRAAPRRRRRGTAGTATSCPRASSGATRSTARPSGPRARGTTAPRSGTRCRSTSAATRSAGACFSFFSRGGAARA